MPKQFINPSTLSTPTGYSHVVKTGTLAFIAGQVAVEKGGNVVGTGDIEAQARQVFANLDTAVKSAGGRKQDIVSTTVYLTNRDHLTAYRKAREVYFGSSNLPTSTLLFISGLARPELLMEVEAIAVIEG
ncbi:MAG: RidA family protein [Chloroflexi bacterium]|nr:RidA family protein [Chloroflexota bacterium]